MQVFDLSSFWFGLQPMGDDSRTMSGGSKHRQKRNEQRREERMKEKRARLKRGEVVEKKVMRQKKMDKNTAGDFVWMKE